MSDSNVIYYKVCGQHTVAAMSRLLTACSQDVKTGDRVLSNKYNPKEVRGIFWEVKATRNEEEFTWDLEKEFKLRDCTSHAGDLWKYLRGAYCVTSRLLRKM